MPWTTLILFGMAAISWQLAQNHADDIGRFLGAQSALFCLLAGLVKAPLLLQGVVLIGLLVYPTCSSASERAHPTNCPQLCVMRRKCRSVNKL
ncbi:hypothetical protein N836_26235 [Leptolyngbya sp. Heron Island J]|uniref:hypothetical protein n=1 Tax=Leptolyngbya sp. Heron Island J TaxID=1385935 RepID=UPI0003B9E60D|nr:hypothetical protein [Leptolyngbya sp. Heron Island J]ESA32424.1 hypothetical protein N836_26235 [Leptolyngbya sp. Heron Island J]